MTDEQQDLLDISTVLLSGMFSGGGARSEHTVNKAIELAKLLINKVEAE